MELNAEYVIRRYPNAAKGMTERMYNKKRAEIQLEKTEVILSWVESLTR
ncbi:MAG: hypothetical protein QXX95_02185 [Nitrososphaerales archaeon]